MDLTGQYSTPANTGAHSNIPSQSRAPYLEQVETLRASGDIAMFLSVPDGTDNTFRLTFANGETVLIDRMAVRWFCRHELAGEDDPRNALVYLIARKLFRNRGGKRALGMSFREWLLAW